MYLDVQYTGNKNPEWHYLYSYITYEVKSKDRKGLYYILCFVLIVLLIIYECCTIFFMK